MIPEFAIKEVIAFQAQEGLKATQTKNSVEFSGFGKFVFYEAKALKKREMYKTAHEFYIKELGSDVTDVKRRLLEKKLASVVKDMEYLDIKLKSNGDQ